MSLIPRSDGLPPLGTLVPTARIDTLAPPSPAEAEASGIDLVTELEALGAPPATLGSLGLVDALLQFVTPRPRDPLTLSQARIAPLLGAAAAIVARGRTGSPDISRLGARALAQELQAQRAIAERRAALLPGGAPAGHGAG